MRVRGYASGGCHEGRGGGEAWCCGKGDRGGAREVFVAVAVKRVSGGCVIRFRNVEDAEQVL